MNAQKIAVIYNPKGGSASKSKLCALTSSFSAKGIAVELLPTTALSGSTAKLAHSAAVRGADLVIAFGGDGTAQQVAEGLNGTGAIMAVYPGGTGNLFARAFYADPTPEEFAEMVLSGTPQPIDMIAAEYTDTQEVLHKHLILVGLGLGTLSDAISSASPALKRIFGRLTYVAKVIAACFWLEAPRFFLQSHKGPQSVKTAGLFVLNVAPSMLPSVSRGCNASDGLMDVVILKAGNIWQLFSVVFCLAFSRPERSKYYLRFRTRVLIVKYNEPRLPNIDGDSGTPTKEIKLSVKPAAVKMVLA